MNKRSLFLLAILLFIPGWLIASKHVVPEIGLNVNGLIIPVIPTKPEDKKPIETKKISICDKGDKDFANSLCSL